ncbi:MAG TPA: hypothetical protein P5137_14885, partial [Candidatus Brocadiia bacterium]|nr:hypothetical protein [Candidatus Brocadiia bacterium]
TPTQPASPISPVASPQAPAPTAGAWVCCAGEFASRDAAIAALKAIPAGAVEGKRIVVSPVKAAPGAVHLACIGPFTNRDDAQKAADALAALKIKADVRDASQWSTGKPKP